MPTAFQLELNLWEQLQQAQASPQEADWQQLCLAFDETLARTPVPQQLATAAIALEQMAAVLAAKAAAWFEDWERSPETEPVLEPDFLADLFRQSMSLDLEDLVAEPERYRRTPSEKSEEELGSAVVYREKVEILAELASVMLLRSRYANAANAEAITQLAPDENVGAWAAVITGWMASQSLSAAPLLQVQAGTGLGVVQIWLAAMLGHFTLEQQGRFYEPRGVVVRCA